MNTIIHPREARGGDRHGLAVQKASFDDVYDAPTPQPYFESLAPLDYRTPRHAQGLVRRILAELERLRGPGQRQILDLCCGYGVNGALAKADIRLEDLFRRYAGAQGTPLAEADRRELIEARASARAPRVVGQDVAGNALAYAERAGFIDAAIRANLEERPLGAAEVRRIADTDLVTVTGGLSYVGAETFAQVLGAMRRPPWLLLFPLRGTDIGGIERVLSEAGLVTERWDRPFPHRRHLDARERRGALGRRLSDGLGPASPTHLEAVLHLARPRTERDGASLRSLVLDGADLPPRAA